MTKNGLGARLRLLVESVWLPRPECQTPFCRDSAGTMKIKKLKFEILRLLRRSLEDTIRLYLNKKRARYFRAENEKKNIFISFKKAALSGGGVVGGDESQNLRRRLRCFVKKRRLRSRLSASALLALLQKRFFRIKR